MRRKEMEQFIRDILNSVEELEYVDDGEEGNIYIDKFARQFMKEYSKRESKEKIKDLIRYMKTLV